MADRMIICEGCKAVAGPAAERLRGMVGSETSVEVTDCMNVCSDPATVAFRAEGKVAYLFAGVDLDGQAQELARFAALYAAAPGGAIEDARPCGALRFCLIGRIPA